MSQKPQEEKKVEYINYIEPLVGRFKKAYSGKGWVSPLVQVIVVLLVSAIGSMALTILKISLPAFVVVPIGVILGVIAFIPAHYTAVRYVEEKRDTVKGYVSLKDKLYPSQRIRYAVIGIVVMILAAAGIFSSLQLTGGVIVVLGVLSAYDFISRTKEEFELYLEGEEVDPIQEAKEEKERQKQEEEGRLFLQQYKDNEALLTDEQKRILLDQMLKNSQGSKMNIEER